MTDAYKKELALVETGLRNDRRSRLAEVRRLPEGNITVINRGPRTVFCQVIKEYDTGCGDSAEASPSRRIKRKEINRDALLVQQLARKEYVLSEIEALNHNIELVESLREQWIELEPRSIVELLPRRCRRVPMALLLSQPSAGSDLPLLVPRPSETEPVREAALRIDEGEIEQWACSPYRENTKNAEGKVHTASNGLRLRSKSELLLAEWYIDHRIPFHYDEVVLAGGRQVSPDFIFARSDGTLVYHEHWGLANNSVYMRENASKICCYAQAGINVGLNLVITSDGGDGGFDIAHAERILAAYLN